MNKRETEEFLAKKYAKQMRKPSPMPKELKEKMDFYRALYGREYARRIYKADASEFVHSSPHLPYGWLAIYDDYTDKDLSFFFRVYKEDRVKRLQYRGVKIRKYLTRNSIRDFQWTQLAKRYKGEPNYKEIANNWSKSNPQLLRELVLRHLWKYPDKSLDYNLQKFITRSKSKGQVFERFVKKHSKRLMDIRLALETKDYVASELPRIIRSAVHRFKSKSH